MNKEQSLVLDFHLKFGLSFHLYPSVIDDKTKQFRINLILEELTELSIAQTQNDIIKIADALGDLIYVVYGAAISWGIDLEPVIEEIHKSNMTKVGGYLREDGKCVKPDTYIPPNIKRIINMQLGEYEN